MCGGSSGTAFWATVEYIKKHKIGADKRVVVILPDNIRNYISKHLNNDWMYERGYITEQDCAKASVSDLVENTDWGQELTVGDMALSKAVFLSPDTTVGQLLAKFQEDGFAQYPVRQEDGKVLGVVTKADLMSKLVKQRVKLEDSIQGLV